MRSVLGLVQQLGEGYGLLCRYQCQVRLLPHIGYAVSHHTSQCPISLSERMLARSRSSKTTAPPKRRLQLCAPSALRQADSAPAAAPKPPAALQEAVAAFDRLDNSQYQTAWVMCQIGRACYEEVDFHQAAFAFQRAQQLDPCRLEVQCSQIASLPFRGTTASRLVAAHGVEAQDGRVTGGDGLHGHPTSDPGVWRWHESNQWHPGGGGRGV